MSIHENTEHQGHDLRGKTGIGNFAHYSVAGLQEIERNLPAGMRNLMIGTTKINELIQHIAITD